MEKLRLTQEEIDKIIEHLSNKLTTCNNYSKFRFTGGNIKDKSKIEKPTLVITADAYIKMFMLIDISETEISWHGLVKRTENTFILYDIVLFPQENTPVHSGTDDEEYAKWMVEKHMDESFPTIDLKCHGHSHVRMGTAASATDDEYQENMIQNIDDGDFYLFMILNKQRCMNIYLYDFEKQILFTEKDIQIKVLNEKDENLLEWASTEIDKNVKTVKTYRNNFKYKGGKRNGFKQK